MRAALSLLVVAFALLVAPARSEPGLPRAAEGYAERVVGAGLLELPPSSALPSVVVQGRRRADVSLLDVAVALPGAIGARIVRDDRARAAAGMLIPVVMLASIAGVFFARLRRPGGLALPLWTSIAATLALVFSTSLALAMRRADATLVAALALLLLVDRLGVRPDERRTSHAFELGLLAATLVLAQPAYTLTALALVLLDVLRRRSRSGVLALVLLALGIVGARVWSLRVGASTPGSDALVHALYGLTLSPGRSLFVYSPIALLGVLALPRLWERDRARTEAIVIACVTALFAIAVRADWHGDPAFGPPLVVPLLPLLVEPAALLLRRGTRTWFMAAAVIGVAMQLLGVAVDLEAWPRLIADVRVATGAPGWFLDPAADIEFVPQLSPVVGQLTLLPIAFGRKPHATPPFALVVGGDQAGTGDPDKPWQDVAAKIDRASLRPNLVLAQSPLRVAHVLIGLWAALVACAFVVLSRARRRA